MSDKLNNDEKESKVLSEQQMANVTGGGSQRKAPDISKRGDPGCLCDRRADGTCPVPRAQCSGWPWHDVYKGDCKDYVNQIKGVGYDAW